MSLCVGTECTALEVNLSDCFPLRSHSDVRSKTGSNIVCDTKRDLSPSA